MHYFILSFNVVMPLIVMLFVGFCLKRYGMTDDRFIHVSSAIVFKVALPISIFHSTVSATSDFLLDYEAWRFVLSACGFSGLVFLFSFIFAKSQNWDFGTKGAFVQGAFRSNYVIIGYPILLSLFDDGVVIKMSLLTLFVIPFFNVLSVFVLAYFDKTNTQLNFKKTMLEVIKNPLIISIVLGMGFKSLHLALPNFLDSSLRSIAGLATPLALINIGAMFGNSLEFKNKLPLFSNVVTRLPQFQTFQVYQPEQITVRCPEACDLDYYLRIRKVVENTFPNLRPDVGLNYRGLWYSEYAGQPITK